jgi:hypothetical protein
MFHERSGVQGAALIQLFQSTGQVLSPVIDRLASAIDDDPSLKAAIQCALFCFIIVVTTMHSSI